MPRPASTTSMLMRSLWKPASTSSAASRSSIEQPMRIGPGKRPTAHRSLIGSIENNPAAFTQHAMRFTQRRGALHEVGHIDRQDSVGDLVGERQLGKVAPDQHESSSLKRPPIAMGCLREHDLGPVEPDCPFKPRRKEAAPATHGPDRNPIRASSRRRSCQVQPRPARSA